MDGLKKQRDRCLDELKDITQVRRKEPELQNLQSQITGLETRLKFSKTDRDVTVSQHVSNRWLGSGFKIFSSLFNVLKHKLNVLC